MTVRRGPDVVYLCLSLTFLWGYFVSDRKNHCRFDANMFEALVEQNRGWFLLTQLWMRVGKGTLLFLSQRMGC